MRYLVRSYKTDRYLYTVRAVVTIDDLDMEHAVTGTIKGQD